MARLPIPIAARVAAPILASSSAALLALAGACSLPAYDPLVVEPAQGLPPDAFERCADVLRSRYHRVVVADAAGFRLQTDWVAGGEPDVAMQQRATVFRQDDGIGCLVELRYLRQGWFDSVPAWSSPRPDPDGERELGEALAKALRATAPDEPPPAGPPGSQPADPGR